MVEVVDLQNASTVGVCFVDFYDKPKHESILGLNAQNVHWDSNKEATFLFRASQAWKNQPGPYLPVSFLTERGGGKGYYIYEGLPAGHDWDGVLRRLEMDVEGK